MMSPIHRSLGKSFVVPLTDHFQAMLEQLEALYSSRVAENASGSEQNLDNPKVGEPSRRAEEPEPSQVATDDSTVSPYGKPRNFDTQKLIKCLEIHKEANEKAISHQPSFEEIEIYKMANQNAMRENADLQMEDDPSTAAEEVHPHDTTSVNESNQHSSSWAPDELLRATGKSQPYKANEQFRVIKLKLKTPKAEEVRQGAQHELQIARATKAFEEKFRAERKAKRAEMGRLVADSRTKVTNSTAPESLLNVTNLAGLDSLYGAQDRDYSNPFLVMRPETTPTATTQEWTRPWRQEVRPDNGVWLCSNCSGFLDRDATIAHKDVLLNAWRILGIWHPFEKVPSDPIRRRNCAYCKRQEFCYSYQKFSDDMEIDE